MTDIGYSRSICWVWIVCRSKTGNTSRAPLEYDVLAGDRFLHSNGSSATAVVGASMDGAAASDAVIATPGDIGWPWGRALDMGRPADRLNSVTILRKLRRYFRPPNNQRWR